MRSKIVMCAVCVALVAVLLAPAACTPTQQGAAIGGGAGAAAGGLLSKTHRTRNAAIAGAAGALIGGVIGHQYEITKFCPTCGRRFHRTKQFCSYDGTPLVTRQ